MVGGTHQTLPNGVLLVHTDDFPRYSLAHIYAEELSAREPVALVIVRHPQNEDLQMQAGCVLPKSAYRNLTC